MADCYFKLCYILTVILSLCNYVIYVDAHVQPRPVKMAWSIRNNDDHIYDDDGHSPSHTEGNQLLATPSSDAIDSSYHRQDGRRTGKY